LSYKISPAFFSLIVKILKWGQGLEGTFLKKLLICSMDKFQDFESWLKANHKLNWRENLISMNVIDKILMVPDLEKVSSVSILNQLLSALRNNISFSTKGKTEKDREIKTFKLYIQFKEEAKHQKEEASS
jgi:hypothetical protein